MIGKKKPEDYVGVVRDGIAPSGQDPVTWLEKRIAGAKRKGEGIEVLESLKRVMKAAKEKRRKRPTTSKS